MPQWLDRLLNRKSSATAPALSVSTLGRPVWMGRNYAEFSEEGYKKCSVGFTCVNLVAQAMAHVPWCLYRGDKKELDPKHPMLKLLRRPNPWQGGASFFLNHYAFFRLQGNCYLEGVGPDNAPPKELYTLRPDRMKKIPGRYGIAGYEYSINGVVVPFKSDPLTGQSAILPFQTFNPLDDWYGMSPIEAAVFSVNQHNEAGAWNQSMLQNASVPSGAFVYKPENQVAGSNLTDEQYQVLKQQLDEKLSGPANARRSLILDGGLDWKVMGFTPLDMDWLNGKNSSAREICNVMGVPAQMLGIPGSQTHANYEEARLSMYEDTVIPLLDQFTDALNNWLTPAFATQQATKADYGTGDGELTLKLDLDEVPALGARRKQVWERVQNADWLTINEKRDATGYEPVDGGDVLFVEAGKLPIEDATQPLDKPKLDAEGNPIPVDDALPDPNAKPEPELDENGEPIMDADGKPVMKPPTAKPAGKPEDGAPATVEGGVPKGSDVQAQSLNGSQLQNAALVLTQVTNEEIDPEAAKILLRIAFPSVEETLISAMIEASVAFTPKPKPTPPAFGAPPGAPPGAPKPPLKPEEEIQKALLAEGFSYKTAEMLSKIAYGE